MTNTNWETEAWFDEQNDIICIKVRNYFIDSNGNRAKQGFIIRIPAEQMYRVAEGEDYPYVSPDEIIREPDTLDKKFSIDERFSKMAEEI